MNPMDNITDNEVKGISRLVEDWGYSILEDGTILTKAGKPFKMGISTTGYYQMIAYGDGAPHYFMAHRLVADKYHPNPDNLPQVNHEDGNKLNNHKDNLTWCTRSQNIRHALDTGLIIPPWTGKSGKLHDRSKPVIQIKNDIVIGEFGSIREAARLTGISRGTIDQVLSGRGVTAGGYEWKYKVV